MDKWLHYKLSNDFLSRILHRLFFFLLTKLPEMEVFSVISGLRDKIYPLEQDHFMNEGL